MDYARFKERRRRGGRGWIFGLALGVLCLLIMLLILVWTNIERFDISYFIPNVQKEITDRRDHLAKLEVERERLLTPHELRQKALQYSMHEPYAGQVRRLEN